MKNSKLVRVGKKLRPVFNSWIAKGSLVGTQPILENDSFPWVEALERASPLIMREFTELVQSAIKIPPLGEISPDHQRIAPDTSWKSFFFHAYGVEIPENCAKAPVTAQLVRGIPGLRSALFSIMEPGGAIPPHDGVTKGMLNLHLGLSVPGSIDDCWISIDAKKYHWQEGKVLIFDDTFIHAVENNTPHLRAILFIQFDRPTQGFGRLAQKVFLFGVRHSAFYKDGLKGLNLWNKKHA